MAMIRYQKFIVSESLATLIINCSENENPTLEQYGPLRNGPFSIMEMVQEGIGEKVLSALSDASSVLSGAGSESYLLTGPNGYFDERLSQPILSTLGFSFCFDHSDILALVYREFCYWVERYGPVVITWGIIELRDEGLFLSLKEREPQEPLSLTRKKKWYRPDEDEKYFSLVIRKRTPDEASSKMLKRMRKITADMDDPLTILEEIDELVHMNENPEDVIKIFRTRLTRPYDALNDDGSSNKAIRWRTHISEMVILSKRYPQFTFELILLEKETKRARYLRIFDDGGIKQEEL